MNLHRFVGRHQGATAWLFGKGPSLDKWLDWVGSKIFNWQSQDSVRMVVNEAALVVPHPHFFFAHDVLGIDRTMDPANHGLKNGGTLADPRVQKEYPKYCTAILRTEQTARALKYGVDPAKVYGYRKAQKEAQLLKLSPLELAKTGALYAESATIQAACHFAKLVGCGSVVLVGVDGGKGTAKVFEGMGVSQGPWYTKNRGDTHRILGAMGMPFTVWGE